MFNVLSGDTPIELLIIQLIAVVIGLTIHEFSHGFASYRLGDSTAKFDGRLSFSPLRHIDPIGFLMIVLVGFGWAKPVMVNPRNLRKPKRDMAIISFAGPLSNFLLAFFVTAIYVPLLVTGIIAGGGYVAVFLFILIHVNIMLGVFNLIPVPPLDGSKIVSVFLPNHLYWRYANFRYGFIVLIIIIISDPIRNLVWSMVVTIFNSFIFVLDPLWSLIL